MKTKLISLIITFAMSSASLCYASTPTITRDYITRKSGGQTTCREEVLVSYRNLQMEQGDYVIISFFDSEDNILEECMLDLYVNSAAEDKTFIASDLLRGTAYIKIELVGPKYGYDGIKVPLNI